MDWIPWVVTGIALAAVVLVAFAKRGPSGDGDITAISAALKADFERIERLIQDNDRRSFDSAEERGRALRTEVAENLTRATAALTRNLNDGRDAQKAQLDTFSQLLATTTKAANDEFRASITHASAAQKDQLEAFSKVLGDGVRSLDERLEAVRTSVDQRAENLAKALTEKVDKTHDLSVQQAKALREEIQGSLKLLSDDLRKNADAAAQSQKDGLEQVAVNLKAVGEAITEQLRVSGKSTEDKLGELLANAASSAQQLREEVMKALKQVGDDLRENAKLVAEAQQRGLDTMALRLKEIGDASQTSQDNLRQSVAEGLTTMRQENEAKLELMRQTVDEKLQGTLEKRLGESFALVTQQLKQVHEGLGDMQKLATGVGELKRVLTNVKSRGTWGETQLASILEDMLSPDQYLRNVKVREDASEIVEFCIKIPLLDENQDHVLLPIDAKFPIEDFERLVEAADNGDVAGAEAAASRLETRFKSSAKDIHSKYIAPPRTTEYAVMYVPSESLYAEMVKRPGLVSEITREFNVVVAGPTNLMSILNAVHAVSRSVTIQQKAGQIAALLLRVQSEFVKYGKAVDVAKKRAESTVKAMSKLSTRQRAMGRTLRGVETIEGTTTTQPMHPLVEVEIEDLTEEDDVDDTDEADDLETAGTDNAHRG